MEIPRVHLLRSVLGTTILLTMSSCDNAGILLVPREEVWVATEPVQCLGNPWEQDWLARHGNNYGAYPRDIDSQKTVLVEYYARFGVRVKNTISIVTHPVTCAACTCPRGDTLYLLVPEDDANTMILLGYRREEPQP
jgi:hypothetical protein